MSYREVSSLVAALGMGGFGRSHLINSVIGAGYLLAVFLGPPAYTLPAVSGGALLAWHFANRRSHVIRDTPTARIRSAAQGYVELVGKGQPLDGASPLHFGTLPPCLFFQVHMHEAVYGVLGKRSVDVNVRRSEETFALVDDTGVCVIDPDYAEVLSARRSTWKVGEHRYQATYICSGDPLYVLGEFHTLRSVSGASSRGQEVSAVLREWKRDPGALLARFDADADGEIDSSEWQRAVQAAERQVEEREAEAARQPGIHIVRAPTDGRPFLISTRDPATLASRYALWAWLHATVVLAGASGSAYVWL